MNKNDKCGIQNQPWIVVLIKQSKIYPFKNIVAQILIFCLIICGIGADPLDVYIKRAIFMDDEVVKTK